VILEVDGIKLGSMRVVEVMARNAATVTFVVIRAVQESPIVPAGSEASPAPAGSEPSLATSAAPMEAAPTAHDRMSEPEAEIVPCDEAATASPSPAAPAAAVAEASMVADETATATCDTQPAALKSQADESQPEVAESEEPVLDTVVCELRLCRSPKTMTLEGPGDSELLKFWLDLQGLDRADLVSMYLSKASESASGSDDR